MWWPSVTNGEGVGRRSEWGGEGGRGEGGSEEGRGGEVGGGEEMRGRGLGVREKGQLTTFTVYLWYCLAHFS